MTESFIINEIERNRKFKNVAFGTIVSFVIIILGLLVYFSTFDKINGYLLLFSLAYFPICLIFVYFEFQYRLKSIKNELSLLNEDFRLIFGEYLHFRKFRGFLKYLISQRGLIIFKNLKTICLSPDSINEIQSYKVDYGRGGKFNVVKIFTTENKTEKILFPINCDFDADFLMKNISRINKNVVIKKQ